MIIESVSYRTDTGCIV